MTELVRWLAPAVAGIALSVSSIFAPAAQTSASEPRFHVSARGAALVERGLAAAAPQDTSGFESVPAPGVRVLADEARATSTPWVDSNAWRFQRGLKKANYENLPKGAAPLAAAEAFMFGAAAIIDPDPADVDALGEMLTFVKGLEQPALPQMADIAVVESDSPLFPEVLNLLTRRNLLYRVVSAPDPSLDLTVRLGSTEFPLEAAADPSAFAARVRASLGDDKRLVRIYGTSTAVVRLTGDGKKGRLFLLNYREGRGRGGGGGAIPTVRVRVEGKYQPRFAAFGAAPDAKLTDIEHADGATEFWVPAFRMLAVIDLDVVS